MTMKNTTLLLLVMIIAASCCDCNDEKSKFKVRKLNGFDNGLEMLYLDADFNVGDTVELDHDQYHIVDRAGVGPIDQHNESDVLWEAEIYVNGKYQSVEEIYADSTYMPGDRLRVESEDEDGGAYVESYILLHRVKK